LILAQNVKLQNNLREGKMRKTVLKHPFLQQNSRIIARLRNTVSPQLQFGSKKPTFYFSAMVLWPRWPSYCVAQCSASSCASSCARWGTQILEALQRVFTTVWLQISDT